MEICKPTNNEEYIKYQEGRHTSLTHDYPISPWHSYIFEEFKPYLKAPVLDVGTRNGAVLDKLEEEGYESWGVEITDIAKWAQIHKRKVIQCDIQKRTLFPDKFFKSVIATHVIEHCYDPEAAIQEIKRILDGHILLIFPTQGRIKEGEWINYGHFSGFLGTEDMSDLLKKNGFEIIKTYNRASHLCTVIAKI